MYHTWRELTKAEEQPENVDAEASYTKSGERRAEPRLVHKPS